MINVVHIDFFLIFQYTNTLWLWPLIMTIREAYDRGALTNLPDEKVCLQTSCEDGVFFLLQGCYILVVVCIGWVMYSTGNITFISWDVNLRDGCIMRKILSFPGLHH